LKSRFPANRYFAIAPSTLNRLIDDWSYLDPIVADIGKPALYFAYGIPVYRQIGHVNWFHLSNVSPFNIGRVPMPAIDYLRLPLLAWRFRRNLKHADVVSAESRASLRLLGAVEPSKLFVSVNGSDDEIAAAATAPVAVPDDTAVVVGTYKYKALGDSYSLFQSLKARNPRLKMVVIGVAENIPADIRQAGDVTCIGVLPREAVVDYLKHASFYISTTMLENSYNAASEGVFLARESYVSDIPVHRELLGEELQNIAPVPGVGMRLMHVRRSEISPTALKTWDQVIADMLDRAGIDVA
jgi:hypothetical protein